MSTAAPPYPPLSRKVARQAVEHGIDRLQRLQDLRALLGRWHMLFGQGGERIDPGAFQLLAS